MAERTPEQWLKVMLEDLTAQHRVVNVMEAWYQGRHPLPAASATNSDLYRKFQKMAQSNLLTQVVDAVGSRLSVEGIRMGDESADEDAWAMWQKSSMDANQTMLMETALSCGLAYVSVWPDGEGSVRFSPEHPGEVTHRMVPGSLHQVQAAVKVYADDDDWVATLWLEDAVYTWRGKGDWDAWSVWEPTGGWGNPYGEVPIRPLLNKPTLRGGWQSEMSDAIPIQERINQTLLNMMVAEEAVAFPQRWATGLEIQKDANGVPQRPFKSSPDGLWVAEDETARFGQFAESSLDGYLHAISADVEAMAAVTSTPLFAMSAKLSVPPSAEALTAMESSLVKKVEARQRIFGEALEDTFRLAFRMLGDARADANDAEVIWRDPSIRSDAALADYVVKVASVGVPKQALWEKLGASPQEIVRWESQSMSEAFMQLVTQVGQQGQQQASDQQAADQQQTTDQGA